MKVEYTDILVVTYCDITLRNDRNIMLSLYLQFCTIFSCFRDGFEHVKFAIKSNSYDNFVVVTALVYAIYVVTGDDMV